MDKGEWGYRRQVNDKFWSQTIVAKKQIILDIDNNFEQK